MEMCRKCCVVRNLTGFFCTVREAIFWLAYIMRKFGRASLKDGQVITRCHENETKMSRKWDENVTILGLNFTPS